MVPELSARHQQGVGTPATTALDRAGIGYTVHRYSHDPSAASYGLEAAHALGVDPAHVFKTLLALVDERMVVAVVPVTRQLDLKALAAAVGGKRGVMADPAAAERSTGYVVGGISPLGQRRALPTWIDVAGRELPSLYVSAGRRGCDIEIAPADLVEATGAVWAAIGR